MKSAPPALASLPSVRATLPPAGLPGLDPSWSRLVAVTDADGVERTFHLLDTWADRPAGAEPELTLLCVHGNPTWSYLWRGLLRAAPSSWRVIAPDHLGMGYSDRPSGPRTVDCRIDDLDRLTGTLAVNGPVVTVAHDWGGIISMGWAQRHRDQLRGLVLTNTAVHLPATSRGPLLIRLAHRRLLNRIAVRWTPTFVRATTSLTWPRPPAPVRRAYSGPYTSPGQRAAVADFVLDIPFAAGHPSYSVVESIARAMPGMAVPALLMWGPRDPVFGDIFLRDIQDRLPQAVLQRYERASHLLPEDAPGYAEAVVDWTRTLDLDRCEAQPAPLVPAETVAPAQATDRPAAHAVTEVGPSPLDELDARSADEGVAVVEVGGARITWSELHRRVQQIGAGLVEAGVGPGVRVALLVPPSIELTVALYAVWRAGGVIVVADKGLGLAGMGRALRSARIDFVVADYAGLAAVGPMRIPGSRISVRSMSTLAARLLRSDHSLPGLSHRGERGTASVPVGASPDDEAAVLFTSGATGPAKGVLYRQRQVRAQLRLVSTHFGLTAQDRLVAAFAPFALFGPALGISSAVPDVDVTAPGSLTAVALADAALAVDATVVFASPAALRNVLATTSALTPAGRSALGRIRLVASFGAPVPANLLRRLAELLPAASLHTPYGMTEAFPLTDISLPEIDDAGTGDGICVGRPLAGVDVQVAALGPDGEPSPELTTSADVTGEIWIRAPHMRDRYDTLWTLDHRAAAHPGWHPTGDVGFVDGGGRLWIQGRRQHVITTADGPVTPVGIEQRVEAALGAGRSVAAVGVGPAGTQHVVVVVAGSGESTAPLSLIDRVRAAADVPVAAVLMKRALPLDIRHNSKIDREALAQWAEKVLAGG